MPYSVPDGFFEQLEKDILNQVQQQPVPETVPFGQHRAKLLLWGRGVAAVAAMVALVWIGGAMFDSHQPDPIAEVEQAFASLSVDDQNYMLSVYQDDLFMND